MTVETAVYINTLDATYPAATDAKSEGDDHLRMVKAVLKATFPGVAGAVTPTHLELNYMAGVTSAIQAQFTAKAALASPALTGTPTAPTATAGTSTTQLATTAFVAAGDALLAPLASPTFTGIPAAPTAAAGTSTTQLATTAFVGSTAFSAALPGQTGNAGKFVTTSGTAASWADAFTGVAKATIETLTGTAIASAATINLDTATGNRVHITGTTAITAVTLTRGPRTVIFDGILTLTHHATTNKLPGSANITTAAGDVAIYEGDGTVVRCVAYTKVDGSSVVSAGAGDHCITVHTGNGHGSTNTCIRRFTTTQSSVGTAITYADSATLGASFTINEAGLYEIYYTDAASAAATYFGASLNSTQRSTDVTTITAASRLSMNRSPSGNTPNPVTRVVRLTAGDVIRPHTEGTATSVDPIATIFSIRKVGV